MIEISYYISEHELDRLAAANPAQLDDGRLRYYYTNGIITLHCENALGDYEFETPVLDFAIVLCDLVDGLLLNGSGPIETPEGSEVLVFERMADRLLVRTTLPSWACACDYEEARNVLYGFRSKVIGDLASRLPELRLNAFVQGFL